MIKVFTLPDLGEGLTESEILSWKVNPGDSVKVNQVIAEVETAKAVVELPSPFEGTVAQLHEQAGAVVEVGKPIVSFDVAEAPGQRVPTLVGYGAEPEPTGEVRRRARKSALVSTEVSGPQVSEAPAPGETAPDMSAGANTAPVNTAPANTALVRPRSTPPVRKLARDLGVDIASLSGSGPDALVTRDDVVQAAHSSHGVDAAVSEEHHGVTNVASPSPEITRQPIRGVRRATAEAMVASAFTAPHVTEFLTIDVTETVRLLERMRQRRDFRDVKITVLSLVAKAVCLALKRTPELNSTWDDDAGEILTMHYVNLGIAAATDRGLVVPHIPHAQSLDVKGLAVALNELTATARAGKTPPAALKGGTFTLTNIGVFGIDAGTPILNPGEAGILAVGAVRRQPWEHEGQVALRELMTLSLSFDHRLVDGAQGSQFLADVGLILRDPAMAMIL